MNNATVANLLLALGHKKSNPILAFRPTFHRILILQQLDTHAAACQGLIEQSHCRWTFERLAQIEVYLKQMSTHIDLTSHADVYSETPKSTADKTGSSTGRYAIRLTIEHSAMALSRVFGLIGTISMMPAQTRTIREDDEVIDVFLEFLSADANKLDLLCRKLSQLTETVSLEAINFSAGNPLSQHKETQ